MVVGPNSGKRNPVPRNIERGSIRGLIGVLCWCIIKLGRIGRGPGCRKTGVVGSVGRVSIGVGAGGSTVVSTSLVAGSVGGSIGVSVDAG